MDDSSAARLTDQEMPPGISYATWPDSSPPLHADHVLSIVCGNSRLHWCIHEDYSKDFWPSVIWKTGIIDEWEPEKRTREEWLSNFMPPTAFSLLFGTKQGPTHTESLARFATRKVSMIPVYIVTTNDISLKNLVELLHTLPTHITMLRAVDFDIQSYDGIGVDRVANLRGALHLYDGPAMVIDAGTCLTWTCSETEKGGERKLRGGGIAPGLAIKLKAMSAFTGKLPEINYKEFDERVNLCTKEKKPVLLYARDTKDSMITSVLREFALLASHIIRNWTLETIKLNEKAGKKKSDGVRIILTGGDAKILEKLLSKDRGHILQRDKDALYIPNEAHIFVENNIIHRGFASVLLSNTKSKQSMSNVDQGRTNCIGQRVIVDKGSTLMRGSVVHVVRGKAAINDEFIVKFDDHSIVTLDGGKVCVALDLYAEKGETEDVENRISVIQTNMQTNGILTQGSFLPPTIKKGRSKTASEWIKALLEGKTYTPVGADLVDETKTTEAKRKADTFSNNTASKKSRKNVEELPIDRDLMLEDPKAYIGRRVAKYFDEELYTGKVKKYDPKVLEGDTEETALWKITYDDGDKEEYDIDDMLMFIALYKEKFADG